MLFILFSGLKWCFNPGNPGNEWGDTSEAAPSQCGDGAAASSRTFCAAETRV